MALLSSVPSALLSFGLLFNQNNQNVWRLYICILSDISSFSPLLIISIICMEMGNRFAQYSMLLEGHIPLCLTLSYIWAAYATRLMGRGAWFFVLF